MIKHRADTLEGLFIKGAGVTTKKGISLLLQSCTHLKFLGLQMRLDDRKNYFDDVITTVAQHGQNLQYLNLHQFHAKHFDFSSLPADSLPALKAFELEHDGFEPNKRHTDGSGALVKKNCCSDTEESDEAHLPVKAVNESLSAWLTARPHLKYSENVRKENFDIHAAAQGILV